MGPGRRRRRSWRRSRRCARRHRSPTPWAYGAGAPGGSARNGVRSLGDSGRGRPHSHKVVALVAMKRLRFMKTFERISLLAVAILGLGALLFHFSVTLVYVFPLNPLKAASIGRIGGYMGTLFSQNWSLFAPVPQHTNLDVLVQCRTGRDIQSGWFDLEGAFLDGLHRYPFGAYVRLVRMPTDAVRSYTGNDLDADSQSILSRYCRQGHPACLNKDPDYVNATSLGRVELQGLASATCTQVISGAVTAVRVLGTQSSLKPWSKRDVAVWRPRVIPVALTPWMAYRRVATIHFRLLRE
jgi:hypothetical protein